MQNNPFSERASEHPTSDDMFLENFSPKALDLLPSDALQNKLLGILSPPGAGKTALLRAFTPGVLHKLCRTSQQESTRETYRKLTDLGVVEANTPKYLGVYLSCASGYSDIPPSFSEENRYSYFVALINTRIVSRTIRAAISLQAANSPEDLELEYSVDELELLYIPQCETAEELLSWALKTERAIYSELDSLKPLSATSNHRHRRFEALKWLASVKFKFSNDDVSLQKLLMFDDVHRLPRAHRESLKDELVTMRLSYPIWLAERTVTLSEEEMFSQGVRQGRELDVVRLEQRWRDRGQKKAFKEFVNSVVDRRIRSNRIISGSFSKCLTEESPFGNDRVKEVATNLERALFSKYGYSESRYFNWVESVLSLNISDSWRRALKWQELDILVERDVRKAQLTLELDSDSLSEEELSEQNASGVLSAAEVFLAKKNDLPYYYGVDRLALLASYNIEEYLSIASRFYEKLKAKYTIGENIELSLEDQHKMIVELAECRFSSIPSSHTNGEKAKKLLKAIGEFCERRTFEPNAPYAPGVTGIALNSSNLAVLTKASQKKNAPYWELANVLRECVAENLLLAQYDVKQGGKKWTVFYINRLIGSLFNLPCSTGGWQAVPLSSLQRWMDTGKSKERELS